MTTYFVPTKNLPLTHPLRDIGIPDRVVDRIDQVVRPIVDAGYLRHDQPGESRPYLSEGRIRRNVQGARQTRERSRPSESRLDDDNLNVQDPQDDLDVQESKSDSAQRRVERQADGRRAYRGRQVARHK